MDRSAECCGPTLLLTSLLLLLQEPRATRARAAENLTDSLPAFAASLYSQTVTWLLRAHMAFADTPVRPLHPAPLARPLLLLPLTPRGPVPALRSSPAT